MQVLGDLRMLPDAFLLIWHQAELLCHGLSKAVGILEQVVPC